MTMQKDAIQSLGDLFIMGFNGLDLKPETARFLTQSQIGGVILFAHNVTEAPQIKALTQQIQTCRTSMPLWVGIDQEGGRVQRCKTGFMKIPSAASIGASGSIKKAFAIASQVAQELSDVGINLNFSPIADIATNPSNPVIGDRSFGDNDLIVAKMVRATIKGYLENGIQPCIKHFPGHGDTSTDSHFVLPRVDTPLSTLRAREFIPFIKAFRIPCQMVMTAHILNSHLDTHYPATLSSFVLQTILRQELKYRYLIVSDDMEMKAIADHFGIADAPRMAISAGCDLLIYRSEETARQAYESLVKSIESGKLSPERVLQASRLGRSVKQNFF